MAAPRPLSHRLPRSWGPKIRGNRAPSGCREVIGDGGALAHRHDRDLTAPRGLLGMASNFPLHGRRRFPPRGAVLSVPVGAHHCAGRAADRRLERTVGPRNSTAVVRSHHDARRFMWILEGHEQSLCSIRFPPWRRTFGGDASGTATAAPGVDDPRVNQNYPIGFAAGAALRSAPEPTCRRHRWGGGLKRRP